MGDYPLDLLTPVRHVASELDKAAPAALSVLEMAATYQHPNTGDLARVKREQKLTSNEQANAWLVEKAVDELGEQLSRNESSYALAFAFDDLRFRRRRLHRLVDVDESDQRRELRAAMHADHAFYVTVIGGRGAQRERRLRLHPLAKALPVMTSKELDEFTADVRAHGIHKPILVLGDEVLDGRHRVAVADALKIPVRVEEFTGTEDQARDRVLSENVHRRHFTVAQRGLLVRELYLPQARKEAEQRISPGAPTIEEHDRIIDRINALDNSIKGKAAEIAAQRSSGLASVRTVEMMAPVDDAPKTKERIRSGEITTAAKARKEAQKERGIEPTKPPIVQPRSAWDRLGCALGDVNNAAETIEEARDDVTMVEDRNFAGRITAIRERLTDIMKLLG